MWRGSTWSCFRMRTPTTAAALARGRGEASRSLAGRPPGIRVITPVPMRHRYARCEYAAGARVIVPGIATTGTIPQMLFLLGWTPRPKPRGRRPQVAQQHTQDPARPQGAKPSTSQWCLWVNCQRPPRRRTHHRRLAATTAAPTTTHRRRRGTVLMEIHVATGLTQGTESNDYHYCVGGRVGVDPGAVWERPQRSGRSARSRSETGWVIPTTAAPRAAADPSIASAPRPRPRACRGSW